MSTLGGGGGGAFSTSGGIIMHVGEQVDKNLSISIKKPNVLNIPDVIMISPDVIMISPRCTHDIHPMYS